MSDPVRSLGQSRTIVCPYHAWTYELTGQLRAGPNLQAVEGVDRSAICLSGVQVEEFLGFVFVNLDPNAEPMDSWFPGARAELEEWVPHWDRLKPLEWVEIPERCNWKVSVENYSECYHCSLNHPTFANGVVKPETYDIQPQGRVPGTRPDDLRHPVGLRTLRRILELVPLADVQRTGLPRQRPQHLPLARHRPGYRHRLARLVLG